MRLGNASQPDIIYRKLVYGDLLDILLLDVTTLRDVDTLPNGESSILGNTQWTWLSNELSTSTARWRVMGQERMMAQFSTAGLGSLISYGDGPVADSGAWDGYGADRLRLLNHLDQNNIDNNVILSGDIHMSFLCDLPLDYGQYDAQTGAGSAAVEFLPTSISRGNFDEAGVSGFLAQLVQGAIRLANPHHVYSELTSHGYGILDVRTDTVTAEFWYSPILQMSGLEAFATGYQCVNGENHWRRQAIGSPTVVAMENPAMTSQFPVQIHAFPNPAGQYLTLQLEAKAATWVEIRMVEVETGREVLKRERMKLKAHRKEALQWDLGGLAAGRYEVVAEADGKRISVPVIHVR
jgi:alkaline phosphatase D